MKVQKLSEFSWYHLTLGSEVDLFQRLRHFLAKENLSQTVILSYIGSCKKVVLVYPKTVDIPPEVERVPPEGTF